MPLSFEQFKQLREKGLSTQQIKNFEAGHIPEEATASEEPLSETILSRVAKVGEATFGRAGQFMFGSTGKTVGGLITGGIGAGMRLSEKPEVRARGEELGRRADEVIKPVNIGFTALELYPGGGFLTQALKKFKGGEKIATGMSKVMEFIPKNLREQAIKQYSQALGATKIEFKRQAEKIIPEMLERKLTAFTRSGLKEKAKKMLTQVGAKFDDALKTVPKDKTINTKPIIETLENAKSEYTIIEKGKKVIAETEPYKRLSELQNIISELGDKVSFNSMRRLRQVWDNVISKSKGFTKFSEEATTAINAKKQAANAIREELAKASPILDKVNAEYTFWKRLDGVLKETLERTSSQQLALSQRIAQSVGMGAGFVKGGIMTGVLGATIMKNLVKLTTSTGWRTISGKTKNQIADYIVTGNKELLSQLLIRTIAGIKNIAD